jgi:hypothetical protein
MNYQTKQGISILGFIAFIALGALIVWLLLYLVNQPQTKPTTQKKVQPAITVTPTTATSTTINATTTTTVKKP